MKHYPWLTTALIAALLFGPIIAIIYHPAIKRLLGRTILFDPELAKKYLPRALFTLYLFYAWRAGGIDLSVAWKVWLYFTLPCFLLYLVRHYFNEVTVLDWLALGVLWLAFDLRWYGVRKHAPTWALDYHLIELSAILISLIWWVCVRGIEANKIVLPDPKKWREDLLITGTAAAVLLVVLVPVGLAIGFMVPKPFWHTEASGARELQTIVCHLLSLKVLGGLLGYASTVVLGEEVWFRVLFQNFLERIVTNKTKALLIGSLLFGLTHLNNGTAWNWRYAIMATLAGLVYTLVYRRTSSVVWVLLLHGGVDVFRTTFYDIVKKVAAASGTQL